MGDFLSTLVTAVIVIGIVLVIILVVKRMRASDRPVHVDAGPRAHDPFAPGQDTGGDPLKIHAGVLTDGSAQRQWLTVEEDPDLQLSIWKDRPDLDIEPRSEQIDLEGTSYTLVEHGTATYRSEGTTGLRPQGALDYVDYEAGDGTHLSFERFDHGRWEVSTGRPVTPGSFTIYPGS